jgi:hypothetical protein
MGIVFNLLGLVVSILLLLISFKTINPWKEDERDEWLRKYGTFAKIGGFVMLVFSMVRICRMIYFG